MSDAASGLEPRIGAEVERVRDEVVSVRRDLHRHPELSHEERRTADLAASRCDAAGFDVRTGLGGTGVVADLDGSGEGPTLMIRADMDALPVQERDDGRAVRSEVDGVMHACGHDGHVAMALGAGAVLTALRDRWSGRLRLCFQPAEERAEGAVPMIDAGAAEGVDRVLGIHLWTPLQAGHVAVTPGVLFGSADSFTITVRGRGGHGGMPHSAIDPVVAAAQVILALQTIVSRETSPFSPAVVTLGKVSGGSAFNVIADSVLIEGTVRALEQSERERLLTRVGEVARDVARAERAEAVFERGSGCPPVVSDAAVARTVHAAAAATVGDDRVHTASPITVGDDVACFLERAPGCYFLVGAGHPERGPVAPHHSADFDIDEASLPVGVETLVRASLALLG
ncbi:MAG: amidohydrolase [Candidatus Dormibacteraeota bacterium]|nr:amidohydrolase [Candidatus Dormibacteraeota bacterium]MBV9524519.1 amidohydrolase [Candidatus Dormibacteraeota bacterium]